MPINRFWIPIIVISMLLGSVFGSQVLGWWSVSGRGSVNMDNLAPDNLRGWMTLQQVADGLGLSVQEVYQVAGIPDDIASDTALKDMEDIVEVSTVRIRLAEYLASDFTSTAPDPAENATTPAPDDDPPPHTDDGLGIGDGGGDGSGNGRTPLPSGEILPADQIKGRMTLREVSEQCGIALDDLLTALSLAPDTALDVSLKTLTQNGTLDEVSTVKDAVAILQQAES